ncbi:GyrI-like domain-containing protein [Aquabacterium sp.]|uniref:GyrI-like domain-containing protein n=1 Tax=Aquabacterium sp. TaxID=1872578 RepID=UPI0037847201
MRIEHQPQALHVIGIELRTSNEEAFRTIPAFWQRFSQQGGPAQVAGRLSDEVYAVYTHFAHAGVDNQGVYSLVIGAAVAPDTALPAGLARAVVPASRRAVFEVERGRFDRVGEAWQRIWQRGDLAKTFIAEYERYGPDGRIEISIGLAPEARPVTPAA